MTRAPVARHEQIGNDIEELRRPDSALLGAENAGSLAACCACSRSWAPRFVPPCSRVVKPETVVRWHRAGFKLLWMWKSRRRGGRPRVDREVRDLIRRMARENNWGAPRIHGELLKLGFDVAERTVSR